MKYVKFFEAFINFKGELVDFDLGDDNYEDKIKNSLDRLIPLESDEILKNVLYTPNFKDYIKGRIMNTEESRRLKVGDFLYIKYLDDDNHLRFQGVDKIINIYENKNDLVIITSGAYTFEIEKNYLDIKILRDIDNSGWTWTLYNVIKK